MGSYQWILQRGVQEQTFQRWIVWRNQWFCQRSNEIFRIRWFDNIVPGDQLLLSNIFNPVMENNAAFSQIEYKRCVWRFVWYFKPALVFIFWVSNDCFLEFIKLPPLLKPRKFERLYGYRRFGKLLSSANIHIFPVRQTRKQTNDQKEKSDKKIKKNSTNKQQKTNKQQTHKQTNRPDADISNS